LKAKNKTDEVEDLRQLQKISLKLLRKILIKLMRQVKRPALQDVVEIENLLTQMHPHVKIVLKLKTKLRENNAPLVNQDPSESQKKMRKVRRNIFLLLKSYLERIQIAKSSNDHERSARMVIATNKDPIANPVPQESPVNQHSRKKGKKEDHHDNIGMTSIQENPAKTEAIEVVKDTESRDLLSNREVVIQTTIEVVTEEVKVSQEVAEVAKVAAEDTVAATMKTVVEEISKTAEAIVVTEVVKIQEATVILSIQDVRVKTEIVEEMVISEAVIEVANQPTESHKLKNDKF